MRTLVALALLAGTPALAAENWTISRSAIGRDVASLPDRCPDGRNELDFSFPEFKNPYYDVSPSPSDPDSGSINAVLEANESSLSVFLHAEQKLRYYSRRAELDRKFERRLASLSGEAKDRGLRGYALFLLYVGEFDRITRLLAPGFKDGSYTDDWLLNFVMNQALFRLGRAQEALEYGKRAEEQAMTLDTRWALLTTQLWVHGDRFFDKFDMPGYTLDWVKKLFPNRDPDKFPFEVVTGTMNVVSWSGTGAINWIDIDHDGFDELLVQRTFFPPKLYRNRGGKAFEEVPAEKIDDKTCTTLIQLPGDADNDGEIDLFRSCCDLKSTGKRRLLRHAGDFRFVDVTKGSGFDGPNRGAIHGAWGDYDLDGCLDFVMADQYGPTSLYKGSCDGKFVDVARDAGVVTPGQLSNALVGEKSAGGQEFGSYSASFGDWNGDGWPDLFVQGWGWKRLYRNKGDGTFEDVTEKAGIDSGKEKKGYNTFFFDYDNDGKLDLYAGQYVVSSSDRWGWVPACSCSHLISKEGYGEKEWRSASTVYRNNGDGTFTDMWQKTRFIPFGVMGATEGDLDNDGYVDVIQPAGGPYFQQAEPALFYLNNGDGTFRNVTPFTALALWGKGHGVSVADYDHDGALDVYLNEGGTMIGDAWASALLHNRGNKNHWLGVRLKPAAGSNKLAVGARVELWAKGRRQTREVSIGGRFSTVNSLTQHFGLGKAAKIDRLVVHWPDRKRSVTELKDLTADRAIEIDAATGEAKTLWTSERR